MTVAWMFAGHGAQYVGMGRTVLRETDAGRRWLAAAERASGLPLGRLASEGPARALLDPTVLEPLLAAVSGAHADLLAADEGPPAAVAAYSAGHVAALYAAGVVDRETCIELARIRGVHLARSAADRAGGMIAFQGLSQAALVALAAGGDGVERAALAAGNAPGHIAVSGTTAALADAVARAAAAGAITTPIEVAGPWHSPLMGAAQGAIAADIAALALAPATIPVWSSVGAQATRDPVILRDLVAASVAAPVAWEATVRAMLDDGVDSFVEVSPGRTLWSFLAQIAPLPAVGRRFLECPRGPARRSPLERLLPWQKSA